MRDYCDTIVINSSLITKEVFDMLQAGCKLKIDLPIYDYDGNTMYPPVLRLVDKDGKLIKYFC